MYRKLKKGREYALRMGQNKEAVVKVKTIHSIITGKSIFILINGSCGWYILDFETISRGSKWFIINCLQISLYELWLQMLQSQL